MSNITFVLGGARSGKSAYAEHYVSQPLCPKYYIATAEVKDKEMAERIALHRQRRGADWTTLEIPIAIAEAIVDPKYSHAAILIDCLTLWLSNLMYQQLPIEQQVNQLIDALHMTQAQVTLVSNEVGQGIVPDNALARQFRDEAGLLHQRLAKAAHRVVWMVAGIPTVIKGEP